MGSGSRAFDDDLSSKIVAKVAEHSYAVLDTPKTLKRKLDACTDSATTVKRKLKLSLERERRLRRKVSSLNEIIDDLKHKQLISEDASAMLESQFCSNDELDMATAKRSGTQDLMQGIDLPDESELDVIVEDLPALSPYLGNVVGYIAGNVVLSPSYAIEPEAAGHWDSGLSSKLLMQVPRLVLAGSCHRTNDVSSKLG
ncbi:hypothetical protein HPB51_015214 [Rhipicephalus microplus]|uniref:Uncharacterized protein n=1 Tax=Rhipicephalus microplus TaxID=6941 RepID=A0A9J6EAE6_RHIMP|nr:hypothetical protein HPB51_015214 [Rhipicephalus microplus]